MHLLTIISKLTNYGNKLFEVDCPQLDIFISSENKDDLIKKLACSLNNFFEIADVKVVSSEQSENKTIHNIKLTVAR
ncbi:MAG TPA: hypothetical protein PKY81_03050 [bacterium]|nr:hypothetical protein [bacterium]HPN29915.1 hypothetical protein [bacterium]